MARNNAQRSFYSPQGFEPAEPVDVDASLIRRFSNLHAECVEAARQARLLSRAPAAAAALIAGCGAVIALSAAQVSPVMLGVWAFFVAAGAVGMLLIARQNAGTSFESLSLQPFAADLHAMLLYAGFAWGAGAFLAIPATGEPTLAAYAISGMVGLSIVLQAKIPILCFLVPATVLSVAAALFTTPRPAAAALIVSASVLVAGACAWAEHRQTRHLKPLRVRP